MNKKLYEKAKRNVESERARELKEEIKHEYDRLVWESEKKVLDVKTRKKVEQLLERASATPATSMAGGYLRHGLISNAKSILENRKYHPKELKKLENGIKKRERGFNKNR